MTGTRSRAVLTAGAWLSLSCAAPDKELCFVATDDMRDCPDVDGGTAYVGSEISLGAWDVTFVAGPFRHDDVLSKTFLCYY